MSSQFFAGVNQQHPQPFPVLQFVRAVEKAVAALVEEPGQPQQGFQQGWSKVDITRIFVWSTSLDAYFEDEAL